MVGPHISPRAGAEVDPRLIVANSIIQLSTVELEQAIARELDENPALELVERPSCPVCGGALQFGMCPRCLGTTPITANASASSAGESSMAGSGSASEDEPDPLWAVAAPLTLPERLLGQLRLTLDTSEHEVALYVVGSLNEHGYFESSVEELAEALHVEASRVQFVLAELQKLEPAGIGARSLTECLLLQLDYLGERGTIPPPATRAMIEQYLEDLGQQHFERIRRALNISREEVEEAFLFIRANLHPHPAHHYYAQTGDPPPVSAPAAPSVLLHRSATSSIGYEVEVVESRRFILQVNPLYQQLRQQPHLATSTGEREHVLHYIERARLFMSHLQRRYLMLHKVAVSLVSHQRDFLDQGPLHLRPLTQAAIAQELGVHVSTISRTTNGKFAQLPSLEVIPLNRFFAAEQRVQELIRQIITGETTPLSDERIAGLLQEQHGITLSRQMIANYRTELGIPSARQRTTLQHRSRKRP